MIASFLLLLLSKLAVEPLAAEAKRKTSLSYLSGGREIALMEILKRGSACALSLPSIVHLEISHVSRDDRFAAMQIVLMRLKGGKGCRLPYVA